MGENGSVVPVFKRTDVKNHAMQVIQPEIGAIECKKWSQIKYTWNRRHVFEHGGMSTVTRDVKQEALKMNDQNGRAC